MVYRTTPKMSARKEAHRARILEAATRLFGRHGYHATTVPMIVAESGSSTGAFYFYFRNKEDVFAAVLQGLAERMSFALNEAIAPAPAGIAAQMKAAVVRLVQFLAENPGEARILIVESSGLGGRLEQMRREVIASHARGVERALAALAPAGAPPSAPAVMARCWVGAVYEAVYSWLETAAEERLPPARLAELIARFNLNAVGVQSQ